MQAPTISELRSKLDQVRAYAKPDPYASQPEEHRERDKQTARALLIQYQAMLLAWFDSEISK